MAILSLSVNCATVVSSLESNKIFDGADALMDGDSYLVDGTSSEIILNVFNYLNVNCVILSNNLKDNKIYDGDNALVDGDSYLSDGTNLVTSLDIITSLVCSCNIDVNITESLLVNNVSLEINCSTLTESFELLFANGGDFWDLSVNSNIQSNTSDLIISIFTLLETELPSNVSTSSPDLNVIEQINTSCNITTDTSAVFFEGSVALEVNCLVETDCSLINFDTFSFILSSCSINTVSSSLDVAKRNFLIVSNEIQVNTSLDSVDIIDNLFAVSNVLTDTTNVLSDIINNLNVDILLIGAVKSPVLSTSDEIELGVSCNLHTVSTLPNIYISSIYDFSVNCSILVDELVFDLGINNEMSVECAVSTLASNYDISVINNLSGAFALSTDIASIDSVITTDLFADCQFNTDASFPEYNVLRLFNSSCDVIVDIDAWYLLVQGSLVYLHTESNIDILTSTPLYATVPFPDIEDCSTYIFQEKLTFDDYGDDLSMFDVSTKLTLSNIEIN